MNRHSWLTPDTAQTHCFTLNWWKKCSFYSPLSTSPCLLQRKVEENTMHLLNVSEIRLKLCLHHQRCQFDWEEVWFVVFRSESAGTMNLCANVAFLCFKNIFTGFLLFPLHHCGLCATDCSAVQKTFKCSKTSEPLVVKTGVFNGS